MNFTKKSIFQIFTYGFSIISLLLIIGVFIPGTDNQIGQAYPAPGTTQAYPPPGFREPTELSGAPEVRETPQLINPKDKHILSSQEINALTTYAYERGLIGTPPAPDSIREPTLSNFPITSINDLTQIIYRNSFYSNSDSEISDCIQARTPGTPVLVHSLDGDPDYYIIPYFKNDQLCVKVGVEIRSGFGYILGVGQAFGNKYPQVNAIDAAQQVIMKTGQNIIGQPLFVFMKIREADPLNPFWQVSTGDNQVFYVIFLTGYTETSLVPETMIFVLKSDEIHPIK